MRNIFHSVVSRRGSGSDGKSEKSMELQQIKNWQHRTNGKQIQEYIKKPNANLNGTGLQ